MALRLIGKNMSLGDDTLLKAGDQNSTVTQLQTILTSNGYPTGGIDGIFGERTKQAVIQFQSSQGLAADGIVGPQTWAALMKFGAPAPGQSPVMAQAPKPVQVPAVIPQPVATPWSTYLPYVVLFGILYAVMDGKK